MDLAEGVVFSYVSLWTSWTQTSRMLNPSVYGKCKQQHLQSTRLPDLNSIDRDPVVLQQGTIAPASRARSRSFGLSIDGSRRQRANQKASRPSRNRVSPQHTNVGMDYYEGKAESSEATTLHAQAHTLVPMTSVAAWSSSPPPPSTCMESPTTYSSFAPNMYI